MPQQRGAVPPAGLGAAFPHPLRGNPDSTGPDPVFYCQWETSPYADTYLTRIAVAAVDKLELGARAGTDFLAVSYSSVDYVGHAFGPRSWEIQDVLARLDHDLAELFAHLDKKVGRGNYVVALSADHGVVPIPEDMQKSGMDAGWLNVESVKERIEKSLEPFNYAKPAVAKVGARAVYFTPGTYDKLKNDPAALRAVLEAIQSVPGVAHVYRAEELEDRPSTQSPMLKAEAASFLKARSGDLLIVPKPYWPWDSSTPTSPRQYGTTHGTPNYYDQRVPVLLMGFGVQTRRIFSSHHSHRHRSDAGSSLWNHSRPARRTRPRRSPEEFFSKTCYFQGPRKPPRQNNLEPRLSPVLISRQLELEARDFATGSNSFVLFSSTK